ncbi:lasso peptide biosynthesis B2 protein [Microbacterium arabinogalactanolyticum]|uniref:lasso peptide biosynthesis B2 protein n=1 Tax=Microbacterium arabinogalactanolyticum TaxID=69365 RepID=UPI0040444509
MRVGQAILTFFVALSVEQSYSSKRRRKPLSPATIQTILRWVNLFSRGDPTCRSRAYSAAIAFWLNGQEAKVLVGVTKYDPLMLHAWAESADGKAITEKKNPRRHFNIVFDGDHPLPGFELTDTKTERFN